MASQNRCLSEEQVATETYWKGRKLPTQKKITHTVPRCSYPKKEKTPLAVHTMPTDYLPSLYIDGDTSPKLCGKIRIEDCKSLSPKGLVSIFTVWFRGCLELCSNWLWLQLKTTCSWDSSSNQLKNSPSMKINYTLICWFQKGTGRNGLKISPCTIPPSPWPHYCVAWQLNTSLLVPQIGGQNAFTCITSSISSLHPILDYLINSLEEVPDFFL